MSQVHLSVALSDTKAIIKVVGRANFECCEYLKRFCLRILAKNEKELIFDMTSCQAMDSTFMGTLTQFSLDALRKKRTIEMVNLSPENKKNLESLGLKKLFKLSDDKKDSLTTDFKDLERGEVSQEEHKANVLNAHQVLIDVHEPNRQEFQDIITFLTENPE